jgi:hypothetical protein
MGEMTARDNASVSSGTRDDATAANGMFLAVPLRRV